jgi:hypothetical protein
LLFAGAMLATLAWFLTTSLLAFAGGVVLLALLLLASKFGAQVVAFFFPPMAAALGSAALLAIPGLAFLLAVVATRGHYLRVLKGHVGHLALFAQVGFRKGSPLARKSEWREFFELLGGLLRRKLQPAELHRLFLINSISAFLLRNPQLILLGVLWGRVPTWETAGTFLWAWTAVSLAVFLLVSVRPLLFLGEAERYVAYSLPAQVLLLAFVWDVIPTHLWWGLLLYSVLLSAAYQAAFVRIHRHDSTLRRQAAELHDFLRCQERTLRILPIAESPHKLAYGSAHEIFYPCGNFQIWHTPVHEYLRIYGRFMLPRLETVHETVARYSIDTVLVNKRGAPEEFSRRLHGHLALFENESFVVYDVRRQVSDVRAPGSTAKAALR